MKKVISVNKGWQFAKLTGQTMEKTVYDQPDFQTVDLPHTWYEDENPYQGLVVYRKELKLDLQEGEEAYLEFQGADRWCRVYMNDTFLGEHKGGYSTFRIHLKRAALKSGKNCVEVFLDNRGFDMISPLSGDFTIYGGLYRNVNLVIASGAYFDPMYYGTCGLLVRTDIKEEDGVLYMEPHVCGAGLETKIRYEIFDRHKNIVCQVTTGVDETAVCHVKNPELWNGKKSPALYTVKAVVTTDGLLSDEVKIRTGFRSIRMETENGFFLNHEHLWINGVAKHQDFGEAFSAVGPKQWDLDMELIEEIGANAVRLSHYQHPQYFYDLCDEKGMVVWAEIPMLKMADNEAFMENACCQLKELIFQNLHHPSICFWGIQNEIAIFGEEPYMYENCRKLNCLVKQLDPGRFTTGANLYTVRNTSQLNKITDMVGYNIYFGWYYGEMQDYHDFLDCFHRDCPDTPLGISEYGVDSNIGFHQEHPKVKDYSEEFQNLFHETVYPIIQSKHFLWGSFVWNMFDFGSARRKEGGSLHRNCKGLVTFDRKIKKDAFYYYKAQWSETPFVHIAEQRFQIRTGDTMAVKVYSNQRKVMLTAADEKWEKCSDKGVFLFENIPLKDGENLVTAFSFGENGKQWEDQAVFIKSEEPEESYQYVDPNPEINVRNWFLDENEKQILFPENGCSVMDPVDQLLGNNEAMRVIEEWSSDLADAMHNRGGAMALIRVINYMRNQFCEEQVKELNIRLNQVQKNETPV